MFARCFTDPLYADFSGLGGQAGEGAREDFVAGVRQPLDGFTATQHMSPNQVIEFDGADSDRAICRSYMYAQHLLDGSEGVTSISRAAPTPATCDAHPTAGGSND